MGGNATEKTRSIDSDITTRGYKERERERERDNDVLPG